MTKFILLAVIFVISIKLNELLNSKKANDQNKNHEFIENLLTIFEIIGAIFVTILLLLLPIFIFNKANKAT